MKKNYWQGNNIRLRAMEEKDLEMYIEERNDPDSVRQWYEDRITFPSSVQDIKREFAERITEYVKNNRRIFIIETLEGVYAGEVSVWYTKRKDGVFRYGIFLEEEFRGKGYGKQALIIVMDYYFNELNYQKASATVYSYNENSLKFHEKLGFIKEGHLVNHIYSRGKYHDMIYYRMLKEDFNNLYKHDFMR